MTDRSHRSGAGIVILGSGLAGYTLARELRKLNPAMPMTILTADGGESYAKPMLSNAFAQGKDAERLVQKTAATMAAELSVTIRPRTRVTAIDRTNREVAVEGAAAIAYDRLVLALGADPRPYSVAGADIVPVAAVNDLDSYRHWREKLEPGARVLLIGGGLIGCEFANDLAGAGHPVTVIEPGPAPLGRLAPQAIGAALAAALGRAGVDMRLGVTVERLEAGPVAQLSDGSIVGFDHALSAIGLVPRTALAAAAGLALDRGGIAIDRLLRTSDPDIYALGDCAVTEVGPLPFVLPLMAEARALARILAGEETKLALPAMPVVVKTPCLPIALCPPPAGSVGQWELAGTGSDLHASFRSENGTIVGFALTGTEVAKRQALAQTMPAVLV